jgi:outer membrane protein, heavy metal efflux system
MIPKSISIGIICTILFSGWLWADSTLPHKEDPEPKTAEILEIETLVKEVLANNPSIKAARANWEAMKERSPQARAWDDLRAGVDAERMDTTRFDTYTDLEFMVSQTIPLSGKNLLRGRVADAEAAIAFSELRRKELELTNRARAAYYRLANAYAQYDLNLKNQELLRQFEKISQAKYEVGTQTQADILMAETDLAQLEEASFDIKRQISDEQSQINILLNHKANSPLGRPKLLQPKSLGFGFEHLVTAALEHRPELHVAKSRIKAANFKLDLSKREWIPDPEIRVEARQFNGSGQGIREYDTGIFFTLPWLNPGKYSAGVREAEKMKEGAKHEFDSFQTETTAMVRDQLKKISTFHHHYVLFRDKILPLAEQTVTAKRLGYETDKNSFLDLISSQRALQEIESMYLHHLTDYQTSIAELEVIIGIPPEQLLNKTIKSMEDSK